MCGELLNPTQESRRTLSARQPSKLSGSRAMRLLWKLSNSRALFLDPFCACESIQTRWRSTAWDLPSERAGFAPRMTCISNLAREGIGAVLLSYQTVWPSGLRRQTQALVE